MENKLKLCAINPDEWSLIDTLIKLLEPFIFATKLIEGKSYQTLSLAKSLETIIVRAFQKHCDTLSADEQLIAVRLFESIQKHLINKIKQSQKIATLVSIF